MNIVMVNDCAHVGETLIKYLPEGFSVLHLKRSRGFFDKTFGIAWRIFRAKGDLYHVHYLLQDCYLALKFGKHPVIGHAHGSDLRRSLKHRVWGRIVRYNLKHCDKVLVSTPDILEVARGFRENTEYIPNPVDTRLFYPKPLGQRGEKLRMLIASSCNWMAKGTDMAIRALSQLKNDVEVFVIHYGKDFDKTMTFAKSLGLRLNALPKTSHQHICEYYWNADVVIDQFKFGVPGMISLEAIACGRPVVTFVSSKYTVYKDFPVKDVNNEEEIVKIFYKDLQKLWRSEYAYLMRDHNPQKVVDNIVRIYETISGF